jgi:OPA family glycerol-3-phosphate transporter-like MFS transporter
VSPALRQRHEALVVALLVVGYAGYYACRANLSVGRTSIIDEYAALGFTKETIGAITSVGTLLYAAGKFFGGSLADLLGGKRMFLAGMGGAVLFTLLFALGGPALFMVAWGGNRFVQSWGWGGMVRTVGQWFDARRYGTVMGVVSLSYLFGDFLSKLVMGLLLNLGWDWRGLFYAGAGFLSLMFFATWALLRPTPAEVGLPEPQAHPAVLVDPMAKKADWRERLVPLLRSPAFLVVCLLSFGFTLMRETFNEWTPTYFEEFAGLAKGDAGLAASLFPLIGGISVLLVGWWTDRMGRGGRALVIGGGLVVSALTLVAMVNLSPGSPASLSVVLVGAVAFVLIGPYSLLAGAIALDFGGPEAGSTASGWVDGVGYVGGIISGYGVAKLAQQAGWGSAWTMLATVAAVSAVASLAYWRLERRSPSSLTGRTATAYTGTTRPAWRT